MNIKCLFFGHDYNSTFPVDLQYYGPFNWEYSHKAAFCKRCKQRIDNPKKSVPFELPSFARWSANKSVQELFQESITDWEKYIGRIKNPEELEESASVWWKRHP